MMKQGLRQSTSKKCPTSLSNNLVVVLGLVHSTLCLRHSLFRNSLASRVVKSLGSERESFSSKPFIMGILRKGGVKSISTVSGVSGPLG
jgi:hypothetical protein